MIIMKKIAIVLLMFISFGCGLNVDTRPKVNPRVKSEHSASVNHMMALCDTFKPRGTSYVTINEYNIEIECEVSSKDANERLMKYQEKCQEFNGVGSYRGDLDFYHSLMCRLPL